MRSRSNFTRTNPRTYEQLGHRVREVINDYRVQKNQFAVISRLPDESPSDWGRLLDQMANTCGIRIEKVKDETYWIGWRDYYEA